MKNVDVDQLFKNFIERENQTSTGFENGIAIPHAKIMNITEPQIVVLRTAGIDWPSMDGNPTTLIIAIIVPEDSENEHLRILGNLTRKLMDNEFINCLKTADAQEVITAIKGIETNEQTANVSTEKSGSKFYVAVTKCPVGVAHTFLAAEKIEKAAHALGFEIKVETQGSIGIENKITLEDVKRADGVIIAADVEIEAKERFNQKRVLEVPIKRALKDAESIFAEVDRTALQSGRESTETSAEDVSVMKAILNGVSHMIPYVVVGGLLIAISLSFGGQPGPDGLAIPEGSFWNKILGIGSFGFTLMIPILAGYIAYAIAGRAALAPAMIGAMVANDPTLLGTEAGTGFLGALVVGIMAGYLVKYINKIKVPKDLRAVMPIFVIPIICSLIISLSFILFLGFPIGLLMNGLNDSLEFLAKNQITIIPLGMLLGAMVAFDMGGPVNKTAFLFGVASIAAGEPKIMGAVAAAIAVPPLSMGLATLLAKPKFTEEERATGLAAILMGLIGITEGAIPFAAEDPKRVIPSIMFGSMIASTLALIFGITNNVPHGGPIVGVLGATNNLLVYLLCIVAGTIGSALMVIALKKKIKSN
ncbi:MAG: PTS fructose transporter subunit IIABC [Mycoplasmatales bacterium]